MVCKCKGERDSKIRISGSDSMNTNTFMVSQMFYIMHHAQTLIRNEPLSLLYLILGLQCLKNWRNLGIIMLRGLFRASLSSSSDESSQIFCSAPNEPWDTDIHREAVKSKRKRTGTQRREWHCIRNYDWSQSTECAAQSLFQLNVYRNNFKLLSQIFSLWIFYMSNIDATNTISWCKKWIFLITSGHLPLRCAISRDHILHMHADEHI